MSDQMKAVRRANRAGQQILRRRGGAHQRRGYQRPRNGKDIQW